MENIKWNYYQYRKAHSYPIFVRFKQEDANTKFTHLLQEFGFNELSESESRKISLNRSSTRILSVQPASGRILQQINGSDLMDKYGLETLSIQGGIPVYTFRKIGLLVLPLSKTLWDLALASDLTQTEQIVGMRVMMTRFLAQSLSDMGVICYWGTFKDGTIVVMKQNQSFGESVLIDLSRRMIYSNGGEHKMASAVKIIRKDKEVAMPSIMKREELISFLTVSNCLLSFSGVTPSMKKAIYDLSAQSTASYASSESTLNL